MISTNQQLQEMVTAARNYGCAALDTEFVWEKTYYPALGLVQVGVADQAYLIDPTLPLDFSPLKTLIEDPDTVKILHDAQQDLTILHRLCGALPKNIYDTRLASGFAGSSSTISLAGMLLETLDIDLPKTESRTNWLQRPLSDKQIAYAKDDVIYMDAARKVQLQRVTKRGTLNYLEEEMRSYDNPDLYLELPAVDRWQKEKLANKYQGQDLYLFQQLIFWRERRARHADLPRQFILKDPQIIALIEEKPQTTQAMAASGIMRGSQMKRMGNRLVDLINEALNASSDLWPDRDQPDFDWAKLKRKVDKLLKAIKQTATQVGLDPALMTSRKEINRLFQNPDAPSALKYGWRKQLLDKAQIKLDTRL